MARAPKANTGGDLGFEAELFKAADKLRGNMEPSDYKHVALGLIFLKHISDAFEAKRAAAAGRRSRRRRGPGRIPRRERVLGAEGGALVAPQANAKQPTIGKLIDDAMVAIEKVNPDAQGRAAQGLCPPGARTR